MDEKEITPAQTICPEKSDDKQLFMIIIIAGMILIGIFLYGNFTKSGSYLPKETLINMGVEYCEQNNDTFKSVTGGDAKSWFMCENTMIDINGKVVWRRGE